MIYAIIGLSIFVVILFVALGIFINWWLDQPESHPFIMDDKQKIDHDMNREGI